MKETDFRLSVSVPFGAGSITISSQSYGHEASLAAAETLKEMLLAFESPLRLTPFDASKPLPPNGYITIGEAPSD